MAHKTPEKATTVKIPLSVINAKDRVVTVKVLTSSAMR